MLVVTLSCELPEGAVRGVGRHLCRPGTHSGSLSCTKRFQHLPLPYLESPFTARRSRRKFCTTLAQIRPRHAPSSQLPESKTPRGDGRGTSLLRGCAACVRIGCTPTYPTANSHTDTPGHASRAFASTLVCSHTPHSQSHATRNITGHAHGRWPTLRRAAPPILLAHLARMRHHAPPPHTPHHHSS